MNIFRMSNTTRPFLHLLQEVTLINIKLKLDTQPLFWRDQKSSFSENIFKIKQNGVIFVTLIVKQIWKSVKWWTSTKKHFWRLLNSYTWFWILKVVWKIPKWGFVFQRTSSFQTATNTDNKYLLQNGWKRINFG